MLTLAQGYWNSPYLLRLATTRIAFRSDSNHKTAPDTNQDSIALDTDAARNVVLIVDDNADARTILETFVESAGLQAVTARDGDEALAVMRGRSAEVCLILLDLMMPGTNGFSLIYYLSREPTWRHIPIIVVSALGQIRKGLIKQPGVVDVWLKGKLSSDEAVKALKLYAQ